MNRVKYLTPEGKEVAVKFRNKKRPDFIREPGVFRDIGLTQFPKKATLAQSDFIALRKDWVRASK